MSMAGDAAHGEHSGTQNDGAVTTEMIIVPKRKRGTYLDKQMFGLKVTPNLSQGPISPQGGQEGSPTACLGRACLFWGNAVILGTSLIFPTEVKFFWDRGTFTLLLSSIRSKPKSCSLITPLRVDLSNRDFKSEWYLKAGRRAVMIFSQQLLRFCVCVCFDVNGKYLFQ